MIELIPAVDDHFAWMLGEAPAPAGLRLPTGGMDDPQTLKIVRRMTQRLHAAGCAASWLMVDDGLVAGLCSFKQPTDEAGEAEIGYGVAPDCRGKGVATAAVAQICDEARRQALAAALRAETAIDNAASGRVLEKTGFQRVGRRHDDEDGDLVLWRRPL